MKYIILQRHIGDLIQETPVIFPKWLIHSDMAEVCRRLPELRTAMIVAAGFWNPVTGCGGKSESLGVSSRGEQDTDLIMVCDYSQGLV